MNSLIELPLTSGEKISEMSEITEDELFKTGIHEHEFKQLIADGVIIDKDLDEYKLIYESYIKKRAKNYYSKTFALSIAPTLKCNLSCAYCFEQESRKLTKIEDFPVSQLINFIKQEIKCLNINNVKLTWFGGEPLIKYKIMETLSNEIIELCEKNNLKFNAELITNGILFDDELIEKIKQWKISYIQVTIDGPKELHDKKRPLVNSKESGFEMIIENLKKIIPLNIRMNIRINVDHEVILMLQKFLEEINYYGIWPQHIKTVTLTLGKKQYFAGVKEDKNLFLSQEEFLEIEEKWRIIQKDFYNKWAKENNISQSKLRFMYPKLTEYYCPTANMPYSFVIDDSGYIHKCMEDIDDKSTRIQNIADEFDNNNSLYSYWQEAHKLNLTAECKDCKVMPICDENCSRNHINGVYNCPIWKYKLESVLKEQYIKLKSSPELISVPLTFKNDLIYNENSSN
jgi:uncharacterized protein